MKFLQLPPEIVLAVLEYLPPHDLLSCQLTNRELHSLIRESVALQYQMALAIARAVDNPRSLAPISDKLEDLRSSEDAWSTLKPKFKLEIPVRHQPSGIYDLTGGAYLLGNIDRDTLHYLKLPTKQGDDTSWRSVKVDGSIVDMGLCVFEHDLVVIITENPREQTDPTLYDIELTLRELSSGQRHPQAKEERILVLTSPYQKPSIGIEIVGDHIFLILTFSSHPDEPEDRIFIYEWRTSVLKASFSAPWCTYASLIFLSEHLVLLPNTQANTLDVFQIPSKPTFETPMPVLTLSLPALAEGQSLTSVSCRAEPNPIGTSSRIDKHQRTQERIDSGIVDMDDFQPTRGFIASSADAICVFIVRISSAPILIHTVGGPNIHFPIVTPFTFFAHRRAFLDLLCVHEGTDAPILWAVWGPLVSRWFGPYSFPINLITMTAGQRCVVIGEFPPETGFPYVVLDFNKDNVKQRKKTLAENEARARSPPTPPVEENQMTHEENTVEEEDESEEEDLETGMNTSFASLPGTWLDSGFDLMDEEDDEEFQLEEEDEQESEEPVFGHLTRIWCVETPEKVGSPEMFAEEVVSELPYVGAASEERYAFDGVLMDEERVIGICTDSSNNIKCIEVHYFG